MLCKGGLCRHAVSVCLSVCPSVTFVDSVETNKYTFKICSPSGSHAIQRRLTVTDRSYLLIVDQNRDHCRCRREAARCFVSVGSIVQYVERNLLLLAVLSLQIYRCVQLNSVMFLFVVVVHAGCDTQRFTDASPSAR